MSVLDFLGLLFRIYIVRLAVIALSMVEEQTHVDKQTLTLDNTLLGVAIRTFGNRTAEIKIRACFGSVTISVEDDTFIMTGDASVDPTNYDGMYISLCWNSERECFVAKSTYVDDYYDHFCNTSVVYIDENSRKLSLSSPCWIGKYNGDNFNLERYLLISEWIRQN